MPTESRIEGNELVLEHNTLEKVDISGWKGKKKPKKLIADMFRSFERRYGEGSRITKAMRDDSRRGLQKPGEGVMNAYAGITVDVGNILWKSDSKVGFHDHVQTRINDTFKELPMLLMQEVLKEYRRLVRDAGGVATGDMIRTLEDAIESGSSTGNVKGHGIEIVQNPTRPSQVEFRITVPYWVYQEEGFDMSAWEDAPWKLPLAVKRKIWEWGKAKGIVHKLLIEDRQEERVRRSHRVKWWVGEETQELYSDEDTDLPPNMRIIGIATEYGMKDLGKMEGSSLSEYKPELDMQKGDDVSLTFGLTPRQNRVLYKLVYMVVSANSGVENAKHYLRDAYRNVFRDENKVMGIIMKTLKRRRILSK